MESQTGKSTDTPQATTPAKGKKKRVSKKAESKALVPQVVDAKELNEQRQEQMALVDEVTKKAPQLFTEAQRRLVLNETPRYLIKKRKGKGGLYFDYVDVNYVVEQLNYVFGFRWSFRHVSPAPTELVSYIETSVKIKQFIVIGELVVPDPKRKGEFITKTQTGRADIKMLQQKDGGPVDVGNDLKAAWSDCLKKCASWFGIALDVYSGAVTRRQDSSNPEGTITEGQHRRLELLANEAGFGHMGLRKLIAQDYDYPSTKQIRRKHFEEIQAKLQDMAAKRGIEELNIPDDLQKGWDILETPPAKRIAAFKAYSAKGDEGIEELRKKLNLEVDRRVAKKPVEAQQAGSVTELD